MRNLNNSTLPLMQMMMAFEGMSSISAFAKWTSGSLSSNVPLPGLSVVAQTQAVEKLLAALDATQQKNAAKLLEGIQRYEQEVRKVARGREKVILRKGNARLIDCGGRGPAVLLIPSLVNRYYILDLSEKRSLAQHLVAEGFSPLLLDWGTPGVDEREFTTEDYVTERLLPMLEFVQRATGKAVPVIGYCMGGLFALALATLKPEAVSRLVLLSTPWDFRAGGQHVPGLDEEAQEKLRAWLLEQKKGVHPAFLQSWFYMLHAFAIHDKYRAFADMQKGSQAALEFLETEHWINDGVPVARKVAAECFVDWVHDNLLLQKKWKVGGTLVQPEKITQPVLCVCPEQDTIVPPACALPLAKAFKKSTIIQPDSGHVGMLVGKGAKDETWIPIAKFLKK